MTHGAVARSRPLVAVPVLLVSAQTLGYLLDRFVLEWRLGALDLDAEASWFGKLAAAAAVTAGCLLLTGVGPRPLHGRSRAILGGLLVVLGLDDLLVIHERFGWRVAHALGRDDDTLRLAWPILYLPLLAVVALLLVRLSRGLPPVHARALRVALGLLAVAVAAELVSFLLKEAGFANGSFPDTIEVTIEEGAELAGWTVVVLAVALADGSRRPWRRARGAAPNDAAEPPSAAAGRAWSFARPPHARR